ncbi:MAG: hypothetical protein A3J09_02795 [Candidatus Zambryskibacteria bacterium RIFCSPLOWO2_02_FULL_51_21]|uniref:Hydrolase TatD n=1 Tax=Candidatus Zambryskibacteria bacterium RIFCSPHIGHO2_02_FULL_43_37 TaxID=1802749 RepID=A0A1G2TGI7_9BACT|nr:MAG: hypothetical protein A2723_02785 [Candidatus Zambryskibacteria bacterium RIFCSPHIGHO2_01_FULL_52_18]OHA96292.1 MAG: hypothetical protein A3D49_00105 [Candidatus Zambryskibacteria bacterium RIFCSPHIGHO2_02_FULL_43_37]OHB07512.1 MAG: hypothetical protein A2944_01395 [Candidatus Zambryskibacteria bacterium RIFCSPLOWO2_01_FULL_52_12]OHB11449.1 MAG: hypothetical protein A3J09_02795 [Candidatus Zambryskibacteria bacterium RIFCSPLOWO2_02_FULL_51_21]
MPKYFDIHSHLNFLDYEKDWDEVIARMRGAGTHTIVVGTDYESSKKAVELADKYPEIYACIGVHPVDNPSQVFEKEKFEELAKHSKVIAIGECGMDFFHQDKTQDFERQKKLFETQIEFALEHGKPVMVHARDSYAEILEIIGNYPNLRGNIHFFAGTLDEARRFIERGFTLSFTGVITFVGAYDEIIKSVPLESIMTETDAPFVAPVPYRGKRNEPSYVKEVVKRIAEIRGEDFETVRQTLVENALRMIMYES